MSSYRGGSFHWEIILCVWAMKEDGMRMVKTLPCKTDVCEPLFETEVDRKMDP